MNSLEKNNDLLCIGKIIGAHGIRGFVKVITYTESPDIFCTGSKIILRSPAGRQSSVEITESQPFKKGLLISIKGISTRNMAEELAGAEFFIERSSLPELEDGTYYWTDMIGLSVYTTEDQYIGRIESVFPTGSNDVYVIRHNDTEILIPAIESVVVGIDMDHRTMRVSLPEGL